MPTAARRPISPWPAWPPCLTAYGSNFHPGDTIYVDTGTYSLIRNIRLGPQLSGVTIQGPTGAGTATLNRGNTNGGQYVFELAGGERDARSPGDHGGLRRDLRRSSGAARA